MGKKKSSTRRYTIPTPIASSGSSAPTKRTTTTTTDPSTSVPSSSPIAIHDTFEVDLSDPEPNRHNHFDDMPDYDFESTVRPEDDEEIDEEEAFNDDDEERWGVFFQSDKKQRERKSKRDEVSLNEEEEEEEEPSDFENDEDAVDISELLNDDDDRSDKKREKKKSVSFAGLLDGIREESEEEDNDHHDDNDGSGLDFDSDSSHQSADDDLEQFVQSLGTSSSSATKKPRRVEETEVHPESEYNTRSNAHDLSLESLVASLEGERGFSTLKSQIRAMDVTGKKKKSKSILQPTTLPAPLPKLHQDKIDRAAAYEHTKKELGKWRQIVEKHRNADHLSFPMNASTKPTLTNAAMVASFKPTNTMESQIQEILEKSGVATEKQIQEMEDTQLAAVKLSPEEILAQRRELAKMRALLFYTEQKEKRASKIKSRSYRKIKKKEKMRHQEKMNLEKLQELDPEAADEERLEMERRRAEERMSLRHKTKNDWVRFANRAHDVSIETRQDLLEHLDRADALRAKINYKEHQSESDIDSDQDAGDQLRELADAVAQPMEVPQKGVMGMKFMQRAMEAQRKQTEEAIREMAEEMDNYHSSDDDMAHRENGHDSHDVKGAGRQQSSNPGRMVFGTDFEQEPSTDHQKETYEKKNKLDGFSVKVSGSISLPTPSTHHEPSMVIENDGEKSVDLKVHDESMETLADNGDDDNPWLTPLNASHKKPSTHIIPSLASKSDAARASKSKSKMEKSKTIKQVMTSTEDVRFEGDDSDDDVLVPVPEPRGRTQVSMHSQRDLIEMAFAADNVIDDEFDQEKEEEIERDAPKVQDMRLPGWGSWAGTGVKPKRSQKKFVKKTEGIEAASRLDKDLKHVVLNERPDKKFIATYQVGHVPYPYQNKDQYEAMMRAPLGKEWNTQNTHQTLIKPRVEVKRGLVIEPLKHVRQPRDKKEDDTSTHKRKKSKTVKAQ